MNFFFIFCLFIFEIWFHFIVDQAGLERLESCLFLPLGFWHPAALDSLVIIGSLLGIVLSTKPHYERYLGYLVSHKNAKVCLLIL